MATYSEDCAGLGIDDEKLANSVRLFPNPAGNFISVQSELMAMDKIEIYSVFGKRVKSVDHNFDYISITDLSKGVYFIKIMSKNRTVSIKLLKR
ncbi:T9SS type A sorting domain-containing protein [Psychroserpens sp.]